MWSWQRWKERCLIEANGLGLWVGYGWVVGPKGWPYWRKYYSEGSSSCWKALRWILIWLQQAQTYVYWEDSVGVIFFRLTSYSSTLLFYFRACYAPSRSIEQMASRWREEKKSNRTFNNWEPRYFNIHDKFSYISNT